MPEEDIVHTEESVFEEDNMEVTERRTPSPLRRERLAFLAKLRLLIDTGVGLYESALRNSSWKTMDNIQKELHESALCFKELLKIDKNNKIALFYNGHLLSLQNRVSEARASFIKLIGLCKDDDEMKTEALRAHGHICFRHGLFNEAEELFKQVLQYEPTDEASLDFCEKINKKRTSLNSSQSFVNNSSLINNSITEVTSQNSARDIIEDKEVTPGECINFLLDAGYDLYNSVIYRINNNLIDEETVNQLNRAIEIFDAVLRYDSYNKTALLINYHLRLVRNSGPILPLFFTLIELGEHDPGLRAMTYYLMGCMYDWRGYFTEAKDAFKQVLFYDPTNETALKFFEKIEERQTSERTSPKFFATRNNLATHNSSEENTQEASSTSGLHHLSRPN